MPHMFYSHRQKKKILPVWASNLAALIIHIHYWLVNQNCTHQNNQTICWHTNKEFISVNWKHYIWPQWLMGTQRSVYHMSVFVAGGLKRQIIISLLVVPPVNPASKLQGHVCAIYIRQLGHLKTPKSYQGRNTSSFWWFFFLAPCISSIFCDIQKLLLSKQ